MAEEEVIIPKAAPSPRMGKGANLVKIVAIEYSKDEKGNRKTTQKGDEGLEFTFKDAAGTEYKDTFWLGKSSQWRMDKMLKAAGVDNITKALKKADAIGKKLWLILKEEFQTENGKIIEKDGYEQSYMQTLDFKEFTGAGQEAPAYSEDKLITYNEKGGGTGAPKAAKDPTPEFKKPAATTAKAPTKTKPVETVEEEQPEEKAEASEEWGDEEIPF
jgi:hypothetical protein